MEEHTHCQQPDRDCPGTVCGYPIPCPWHTALIDTTTKPPTVALGLEDDYHRKLKKKRLQEIGNVIARKRARP